MPRYFLHLHDGDQLIEDLEGGEFSDLASARLETLAAARDLLAELVKAGRPIDNKRFEIVDESGEVLATVLLKDVIVW